MYSLLVHEYPAKCIVQQHLREIREQVEAQRLAHELARASSHRTIDRRNAVADANLSRRTSNSKKEE